MTQKITTYTVSILCVRSIPAPPKTSSQLFSFKFTILYKPLNTIGKNINDANSDTAILKYISFNL